MASGGPQIPSLVVTASSYTWALLLADVGEVMRPLPIEAVVGQPSFVLGLSIVRGKATPVVDLGRMLGPADGEERSRFVTLRAGDRALALAVDSVLGVRALNLDPSDELSSVLGAQYADRVAAIGEHKGALVALLRAIRILPESVWRALDAGNAPG